MTVKELQEASRRVTGIKEVTRAINKKDAVKVYIADDADRHITDPIVTLCREHQIDCERISSMKELGEAAGIDIGASAACIVDGDN